jgi:hypothetical protein
MRDVLAYLGQGAVRVMYVNSVQVEDATRFLTEVRVSVHVHAQAMLMRLFTCNLLAACLAPLMKRAGVTRTWCN